MTEKQQKILDEIYNKFLEAEKTPEEIAEELEKALQELEGDDGQRAQELTPKKDKD